MLNPPHLQSCLRTRYCGRHLLQFRQLDSTNRLLADLTKAGLPTTPTLPEGTTAIATQQLQGRGRQGREWLSSPGGIYISVVLYPQAEAAQVQELTLALAWGIALQLNAWRSLNVRLKWPNDLTIDGRKLGGLLLQARFSGERLLAVIAGAGINGYNPTPDIGIALSHLLDEDFDLAEATAVVLGGIERGYETWKTSGLLGLAPSYQSLMLHRDRDIAINGRSLEFWASTLRANCKSE